MAHSLALSHPLRFDLRSKNMYSLSAYSRTLLVLIKHRKPIITENPCRLSKISETEQFLLVWSHSQKAGGSQPPTISILACSSWTGSSRKELSLVLTCLSPGTSPSPSAHAGLMPAHTNMHRAHFPTVPQGSVPGICMPKVTCCVAFIL